MRDQACERALSLVSRDFRKWRLVHSTRRALIRVLLASYGHRPSQLAQEFWGHYAASRTADIYWGYSGGGWWIRTDRGMSVLPSENSSQECSCSVTPKNTPWCSLVAVTTEAAAGHSFTDPLPACPHAHNTQTHILRARFQERQKSGEWVLLDYASLNCTRIWWKEFGNSRRSVSTGPCLLNFENVAGFLCALFHTSRVRCGKKGGGGLKHAWVQLLTDQGIKPRLSLNLPGYKKAAW